MRQQQVEHDVIVIELKPDDARRVTLELDQEQREELEEAVRTHPKAYMRHKAGALLKVADGWAACDVADYGLARRFSAASVRSWVHQYEEAGLESLLVSPGRGRKPAFFSSV